MQRLSAIDQPSDLYIPQEWSFYLSYGAESFARLADEGASRRVGTSFFLNILQMDPPAFLVRTCLCDGTVADPPLTGLP
jgi:hypothetical protein